MNTETATALVIILFVILGGYILAMIFSSRRNTSFYTPSPGTRVLDPEDEDEDIVPLVQKKLGPTDTVVSKTTSAPIIQHKTHTGQAGVVGGKRKYTKKNNQGKVIPLNKEAQEFVKGKTVIKPGDKVNGKTVAHEYDQEILAMSKSVTGNSTNAWLPPDSEDVYVNHYDTTPKIEDHSVNFGGGDFGGSGAGKTYTPDEVAAETDTSTD